MRSKSRLEWKYKLTRREVCVVKLLMKGHKRQVIADRLKISLHTVNTHVENVYDKLGVHNTSSVIAKIYSERLFPRDQR